MGTQKMILFSVLAVALWGGVVSYVLDQESLNKKSCPGGIGTHLIVGSFTGSISGLACMDAGLSQMTMIIVSALASSIGLPLLHLLQLRVLKFFDNSVAGSD